MHSPGAGRNVHPCERKRRKEILGACTRERKLIQTWSLQKHLQLRAKKLSWGFTPTVFRESGLSVSALHIKGIILSVPPCDANTHHEVWPTVQCYSGFVYTKSMTMSCVKASFHIFAQFHCPEEKAYSFLTSSGVKEFSLPNKQTRKLMAF